jgi:NTP pyrophosphatase (non-canonical NTP hydrolase)
MKLEKIIKDTQEVSSRLYAPEVLGTWDLSALMADVVGEAGTLAHSVLTVEGIAAAPPETAHIALDITRLLFMLVNLSNYYHLDLAQAWEDLIREGYTNLAMLENNGAAMKND